MPERSWIHSPEEHPHSSTTGSGVSGAGSHVFPVQLSETAGALRAQHSSTEQAQGGMLPIIICRLGTPEEQRGAKHLKQPYGMLH